MQGKKGIPTNPKVVTQEAILNNVYFSNYENFSINTLLVT